MPSSGPGLPQQPDQHRIFHLPGRQIFAGHRLSIDVAPHFHGIASQFSVPTLRKKQTKSPGRGHIVRSQSFNYQSFPQMGHPGLRSTGTRSNSSRFPS